MQDIKRYHFKEISSTQDFAKELLETEGLVVVSADFQTAGRGRNSKTWVGSYGDNIYCTFGIKHENENPSFERIVLFQALGGLCAYSALKDITSHKLNFRLKYPNDVMYIDDSGKHYKICGILAEHCFQGEICSDTVIGIGVNVNQTQFEGVTTNDPISLKLLGYDVNPEELLQLMIMKFIEFTSMNDEVLFNFWRKELDFIGKIATLRSNGEQYEIQELLNDGRIKAKSLTDGSPLLIDNGDSIRYRM
jgi:BirA family biotin operon repressor/biotin-[acetyl-CoA-carboxylase] ligase